MQIYKNINSQKQFKNFCVNIFYDTKKHTSRTKMCNNSKYNPKPFVLAFFAFDHQAFQRMPLFQGLLAMHRTKLTSRFLPLPLQVSNELTTLTNLACVVMINVD